MPLVGQAFEPDLGGIVRLESLTYVGAEMVPSFAAFLIVLSAASEATERPSYLVQMNSGKNQKPTAHRYRPQPGDLVLFDSGDAVIAKVYALCNSGTPLHAAVIFRKDDGSLGILEAGTNAVMKVFVFDLHTRLHEFEGAILIRKLRRPLTTEQSIQLRDFALAQEGKPYALGRAIMHASPFRPRDPFLMQAFGRTVLNRERWICSELAVAAATAAGVLNENDHPANLMLPRDLCYDERYDLSAQYELPALWYPRPQVEQIGDGVRLGGKN